MAHCSVGLPRQSVLVNCLRLAFCSSNFVISMKAKEKKNQHWVAQTYLEPWCDPTGTTPEPYVWRYSKDGSIAKRKSPGNSFAENELYTFLNKDGTRNVMLEDLFGMFESHYAPVIKNKVIPGLALEKLEIAAVTAFMAAQLCRTPAYRDAQREMLTQAIEPGERLLEFAKKNPDARYPAAVPGDGPAFTLEQMKALHDFPLQLMAPPLIIGLMQIFAQMNLVVLHTDDEVGFVTSDQPCTLYNPLLHLVPPAYRNIVPIVNRAVEVTLPLTPNHLALLTMDPHLHGIRNLTAENKDVVNGANQLTCSNCHKEFVVRRNHLERKWLEPLELPADRPYSPFLNLHTRVAK